MSFQSIHFGLCQYTLESIQGLSLVIDAGTGEVIPSNRIQIRRIVSEKDVDLFPVIQISPWTLETVDDETFEDQNVQYNVLVAILWANNQDYDLSDQELLWREQIVDLFDGQPLIGVTQTVNDLKGLCNVGNCTIEPVTILEPDTWVNAMLAAGSLVLKWDTNRPRNRNV